MHEIMQGDVLAGRYKVERLLGTGGVSKVYLAEDLILKTRWALKKFSTSHLDEEEKSSVLKQINHEISILSKLSHPLLPRIADSFSEAGDSFIVLEYVDGESLSDIIKREGGPLSEARVREWALQICDVLEYLHTQKPPVIYRDLKPQNLILDLSGAIRFIDFGIARLFNPVKERDTIFMGTPGFSPPEQFGNGQTDHRSDIYSFGATLFFLLTAQDPGENPFHFEPVSKFNKDVSPFMESIVARAVEMEPHYRFASVRQMKQVLKGEKKLEDLPSPAWVLIEPSELSFENVPRGKTIKETLRIISADGSPIKGRVRSEDPWIEIGREYFYGDKVEISLELKTDRVIQKEAAASKIEVITDTLKIALPVNISFLPSLIKRFPDWISGLLFFLIPIAIGALWYGVTRLRESVRAVFLFQIDLFSLLLLLMLIALTLFYRGKRRNFVAIVVALCVAFFSAEGKFMELFLFLAYTLWSSRTIIKLYNDLNSGQQIDLEMLYFLSLGIPTLVYCTALYCDSFFLSPELFWHGATALVLNLLVVFYSIDRWRPPLTRKISPRDNAKAPLVIWEKRFWEGTPLHYLVGLLWGLVWGALALSNIPVIRGNTLLLFQHLQPLFRIELWTIGLPYTLSEYLLGGQCGPYLYAITIASAAFLGILSTSLLVRSEKMRSSRCASGRGSVILRVALVTVITNLFILSMLLLNVFSQRDIYYTRIESLNEAQLKRIARGALYSEDLRAYAYLRLATLSFKRKDYRKALFHYGETQRNLSPGQQNYSIRQVELDFMKGICNFYAGNYRESLALFEGLVSYLMVNPPSSSGLNVFRIHPLIEKEGRSSFLDVTRGNPVGLKNDRVIAASIYYYYALCKEQLLNYHDMTGKLERALQLYKEEPAKSIGELDERRIEIEERLTLIHQQGLGFMKTGEVLYNEDSKKRALVVHSNIAKWLQMHGRPDLGAIEENLATLMNGK